MDYSRPALADRLASEYVLGTLRGPARRRFDALLPSHPALQQAVARWRGDLMPLAQAVAPVEPSERVWQGVQRTLFAGEATRSAPWWQRLGVWRGATGVATVAALALAVLLALPPAPQPPIVVVMNPDPSAPAARFVASVSADGRALVLRPLDEFQPTAGRALELWAVPAQGAPRSLGLVAPGQATRVLRTRLLDDTAAFAVSVEPAGGSPTGAPTGPIVSLGRIQPL
jgi:anti-sigma-K factor RskA